MTKICFLFCFIFIITSISAQQNSFDFSYQKFIDKYVVDNKVDYSNIKSNDLEELNYRLSKSDITNINSQSDFGFLINAYNFLVITQIKEHYPINSVKDIPDFFDKAFPIGQLKISLNEIEKEIISQSGVPRLHLLLNCGAISCPPLMYIPEGSDLQLLSLNALNHKNIQDIDTLKKQIKISKIFYWYADDFGSEDAVKKLIASFRKDDTIHDYKVTYLNYNWVLNDISSKDYLIYYPTKLYKKGGWELKVFNNYYTQSDNGLRSNFFSSFLQLQIGTNKNINFGLDVKLRSVNQGNVGLFSALDFKNEKFNFQNDKLTFSRFGISAIGPRIKYQPFKNKGHINFLHSIYFVPMSNTEGNFEFGYFDFQNIQIFNNIFIEKELSIKKRLFFDIGLHFENIKLGLSELEDHSMQIQVPVTAIYSYFPNPKTTFYALINVALKPIFSYNEGQYSNLKWDGYAQVGLGAKYYISTYLEIELLYTYFADQTPGRIANTFNLGLRFFKF